MDRPALYLAPDHTAHGVGMTMLQVYEAMCVVLEAKQPMERAREDAAAKAAAAAKKA